MQKLGWHYNWNNNYTSQVLPETSPDLSIDAEFVPMLYVPSPSVQLGSLHLRTRDELRHIWELTMYSWRPDFIDNPDKLQDGFKLILGYNEPGPFTSPVDRYLIRRQGSLKMEGHAAIVLRP